MCLRTMYIRNEESVSTTGKRFRNVLNWFFEDLNLTDAKKLDRNNLSQQSCLDTYSVSNFFLFNTGVCFSQQCLIITLSRIVWKLVFKMPLLYSLCL